MRDGQEDPGWLLKGDGGLARSHWSSQRAGTKVQRQETIWQGVHEDQHTAESLGLKTFVQMRALATQPLMYWGFTMLVFSAKRKSSGSREKAKKNSFVKKASKNQDVFF